MAAMDNMADTLEFPSDDAMTAALQKNTNLKEENIALRTQLASALRSLKEYRQGLTEHNNYASELGRRTELLTKEKDKVISEILETENMFPEIPKRGQSGSMFEKYILKDSIPRARIRSDSSFRWCDCRTSGKTLLVKEYHKKRFNLTRRIDRICNEIRTLRAIDHPNIAKIRGVYHEEEVISILLESSGCDLFELIGKYGLEMNIDQRLQVATSLMMAVSYLHSINVCHMDIRPENIMVENTPTTLKIVDFETCVTYDPNETYQMRVGTEEFAAPEMLMGEEYNPKSVDLWALGYTLLEMEIGHIPFSQNVFPFSRHICSLSAEDFSRPQVRQDMENTISQFFDLLKGGRDSPMHSCLSGLLKLDPSSRTIPSDLQEWSRDRSAAKMEWAAQN
uniref:Protein kinase domain-containing protein n=1 Tax=Octactis speculum TaxID=3111310 RepID=A0A7S2GEJ2_9STRA|mmetsp:Transcript_44728/g.61139  ORF Transcript_44728/g.61139 Transcript_44728/m.61139 type:complete len:394 (+) Transcript_44728:37-1218(+)|eukprot:CAMPEP_0185751230 /NCGR_PEP_ID=MMETSP1174-20130828/9989_1 /TAXON_ID=35687 /ORGANISM="Dictyocha speculum, Strain CCMP1381" /LENGTH=393 /DNA_ID=CAMNT_0028428105 /DNA_START=34 /DNA_END=1215 /DNA_ORIENTATION=-